MYFVHWFTWKLEVKWKWELKLDTYCIRSCGNILIGNTDTLDLGMVLLRRKY